MFEEKKPLLIFQKLAAMIAEVEAVGKDGQVQSGPARFKFRGIDQIYNAMSPLFAAHGVFPVGKVVSLSQSERKTNAGAALYVCTIHMRYCLFASDGSSVETESIGEAMDSGDKAANKAMSYAYKYAMMQLLCIPTEAIDGDSEQTHHELTQDQQAAKAKIDAMNAKTEPIGWPKPDDAKPIMMDSSEVEELMKRAKSSPVGQMETIEKEINGLHLRDKTLDTKNANEIMNIVLTRMVINFSGEKLKSVVSRLPVYAARSIITQKHCEALIGIWKSKNAPVENQDAEPVGVE